MKEDFKELEEQLEKLGLSVPFKTRPEKEEKIFLYDIAKKDQTIELVRKAIKENPYNLKDAAKRLFSEDLCEEAIEIDGLSLQFIPQKYHTRELYLKAVSNNGLALEYVPFEERDVYISRAALEAESRKLPALGSHRVFPIYNYPIKFIPQNILDKEMVLMSVQKYPLSLRNVPLKYVTKRLCKIAVNSDGIALEFVPERYIDDKIIDSALETTPSSLKFVPEELKTESRCNACFNSNPLSILHIPQQFITLAMCQRVVDIISKWPTTANNRAYLKDDLLRIIPKKILTDKTFLDYISSLLPRKELMRILSQKEEDAIDGEKPIFSKSSCNFILKKLGIPAGREKTKLDLTEVELPALIDKTETELALKEEQTIHDFTSGSQYNRTQLYYVTDIHIEHQLKNHAEDGDLTGAKIDSFISYKITEMLEGVTDKYSTLLIGGDVAGSIPITNLFYMRLSEQWEGRIIAVMGNHELWNGHPDPKKDRYVSPPIDVIVKKYDQEVFEPNNITLLQNSLYISCKELNVKHLLSEDEILSCPDDVLEAILAHSSLIILGGIGFSGLNPFRNATIGLYRAAITTLEADFAETKRFADVYDKVERCARDQRVIVLTHTQVEDWTNKRCNPNWIYINGHTHRNCLIRDSDGTTVLSDNQIGYEPVKWKLNAVFISNGFETYKDGIYEITKKEYKDFNSLRGVHIYGLKTIPDTIMMLKKNSIYMFLIHSENGVCLLSGGKVMHLTHKNIEYYYEHMEEYRSKMLEALKPLHDRLYALSNEVRLFGGSGKVHGCIVDISFDTHLYLNILDGSVTPYFAIDMVNKYTYPNITALLKKRCPELKKSYLSSKRSGLLPLLSDISTNRETEIAEISEQIFFETDIYEPSKKLRAIQYMLEQNIIRIWYDDLLAPKTLTTEKSYNIEPGLPLLYNKPQSTYKVGQKIKIKYRGVGVITDIIESGKKRTIKFVFEDGALGSFSEAYVDQNTEE
ncbi:MAG: DUF4116 domain-containing protein [Ruminococcus sp.]|nr:DUF4116 domain-containing protein [Ruminococcus sp.]